MNMGAWQATVHGVTKRDTTEQLSLTSLTCHEVMELDAIVFVVVVVVSPGLSPFSEHAPSPSSQNSDCAVVTSSSTIYLFFYFIFYQLLFTLSPSFLSCYAVALLFYFFGRGSLFYFIFSICLCFLICCLDLSYFSSKEQASFNFVAAVTLNMAWGHSGLMDTSRCWESGAPREGIEVSCHFPHTLLLVGCF